MKNRNRTLWAVIPVALMLSSCSVAYETPSLGASDIDTAQSVEIIDGKEQVNKEESNKSEPSAETTPGDDTTSEPSDSSTPKPVNEELDPKDLPEGAEIDEDGNLVVEVPFEVDDTENAADKSDLTPDTRSNLEKVWISYTDARKSEDNKSACSFVYLEKDTPVKDCLNYLEESPFADNIKIDFDKAVGSFYLSSQTAQLVQPNESGVGAPDKLTFKETNKGEWKVYLPTLSS